MIIKMPLIIVLSFFINHAAYGSSDSESKNNSLEDKVVEEAWNHYKSKRYIEARQLIDKHYYKAHVYFSLLSGMLYAKENKCKEALSAIEYVSGYYDANRKEIDKSAKLKNAYINMKRVSIECNRKLMQWQNLINNTVININYASDEEKSDLLAILGQAYESLAYESINNSVQAYQKAVASSGDEEVMFRLSVAYSWNGQHEKAVDTALQLLKVSKNKEKWIKTMKASDKYILILADKRLKHL